ncbi:MAG: alpha/beta hydrolase [Nocardioidaceae bacterium]|nr:alpha/beta hydrolase [Nocardioidaceae bacterium]
MSTPRRVTPHPSIRPATTDTERGTFATWVCTPAGSSLPRGNVILVPGFTGSKEDFGELLPLLADTGWQAATYDQRGQFETPAGPDDDLSLAGLSADLVAVIGALFGRDERTHLVGHSFGGLVASTAVVESPELWASLTLMCSGPGGFDGPKGQEALDGAVLIETQGLEAAYRSRSRQAIDRGQESPTADVEGFLRTRFMANSKASLAAMARLLATAPDRTAELVATGVKVAILRGADDDAWPHAVQDEVAAALGTSVVVISKSAHSPAVEAPEDTRDSLARIWMS